jgi:hypothetical protein
MGSILAPARRRLAVVVAAAVALLAALAVWQLQHAGAATSPADKIGIAAGDLQIINQNQQPNANSAQTVTLFDSVFKTSTPTDLLINVSAECGLYTAVSGKGGGSGSTSSSSATGIVTIWLELDGNPVATTLTGSTPAGSFGDPNASPPTTGNGPVVFCNRALTMNTANLGLDQLISLFMNTRSANAFQWFSLNVGNGNHELQVKATLEADTASSGTNGGSGSTLDPVTPAASALIGQRTLTITPVHLANSATF